MPEERTVGALLAHPTGCDGNPKPRADWRCGKAPTSVSTSPCVNEATYHQAPMRQIWRVGCGLRTHVGCMRSVLPRRRGRRGS